MTPETWTFLGRRGDLITLFLSRQKGKGWGEISVDDSRLEVEGFSGCRVLSAFSEIVGARVNLLREESETAKGERLAPVGEAL